jgi:excisionase family DNA binding protein
MKGSQMLDEETKKMIERALRGYITTAQAAGKLDVTPGRIRQLITEKRLPAVLIGGIYFIDPSDLKLIGDRKPGPKKKIINLKKPD